MFGSLIRLSVLGALVGGSAFALVGPDRVAHYIRHGRQVVLSTLDEMEGLETQLSLARQRIESLDGEWKELRERQIRLEVETERLEERLAERRADVERLARALDKARALLSEPSQRFVIGGVAYERSEVEADAARKLALYESRRQALDSLEQTLRAKRRALELAKAAVERSRRLRGELLAKVELLEAELDRVRAKQSFVETAERLADTSDIDGAIADARRELQEVADRIAIEEKMLDRELAEPEPAEIDYDAPAEGGPDLLGRIERALGSEPAQALTRR